MTTVGFRPPITVFLAHPDTTIRQSINDEVAGTGITIVGESDNGDDALEKMLELAPDVALIAVDPALDGLSVCAALRATLPVCRALLLAG